MVSYRSFARLRRVVLPQFLSVLICISLLINAGFPPPPLYAQSNPDKDDSPNGSTQQPLPPGDEAPVFLPIIQAQQSAQTAVQSPTSEALTPQEQAVNNTPNPSAFQIFLPWIEQQIAPSANTVTVHSDSPPIRASSAPLPTPSGAMPPYPLNHQLDSALAFVGVPPANHDFEAASYLVGMPPSNHDFAVEPYDVGVPPTNHNFETGNFTGWTTSGTVTIQNDTTRGYWASLQTSGILVSAPITVTADTQQLALDIGYLTTNNYSWVDIYVLSGPAYATETKIVEAKCSSCGYWETFGTNLSSYQGQSIKLKFNRRFGTVGIDTVRTRVLFDGYTLQGAMDRITEANGNVYAKVAAGNALTTPPFAIESSTQQATIDMIGLTTNSDQYRIDVLSGPTFGTITQVALNTNAPDNWQSVPLNLTAWQGQTVKLRITALYRTVGVDNVGLQSVLLPSWQITGNASLLDEGNGNHYIATSNNLVSAAFSLSADVQQLSLRHRSGTSGNNNFELKLLRGANFTEEIDLTAGQKVSNPNLWQTFKIGVNLYAGETVKFKVVAIGPMHFDDVGIGENLLPGWQLNTHNAIATGADLYGSYVTSPVGGAFTILSSEIATGILEQSNSVEFRYYAVAYDIGQSTGSLLRVYWRNAQGQDVQLIQDAANAPTGYRIRYFAISDLMAQSGQLIVNVTGGGKLYSIADNIARQHLQEPYAQNVGAGVDSSTGGFSLARQDLAIAGSFPLTFTRYYNSHLDIFSVFGYGWSHSYATKLFITQDGDGAVSLGTGQELFFDWSATNQTFAPFDARTTATLVKHNDATFTFTATNGDQYHFDTTGRLSTINRGTNQASLGYDGSGRLSTVTASSGGTLTLTYDGNGRLGGVTGNNGASVTYSYDGNGDLVGADRTNSGLDSYGYDRHRLSQVSNDGTTLVLNSYDDYHRVTEHADPTGQNVTFHYRTPAVGVTAVLDLNSTYYYFDRFQRTTFVLYPDGSTVTYVYDAIGNLIDTVYDGFNQPPTVMLTATPVVGETPLEVAFTATASDPDNDPLTYRWVFGDGTTGGNNATINHLYTGAGIYTATVSVSDTVATVSVPVAITVNPNLPDLIPDEITPTAPTAFAAAVDFLYTGTDPVQTGVLSGTIEAKRTAVLRGRVLTRAGQPLPGVQIAIQDHPEFGQTQSRIDGYFDMAVNGGGPLTLNFTHNGHLPVQRQQDVAWQDFTLVDDVVMTSLDPVVTTVDLNANTPIQVSRGSVVTDENGVRQSTLLIPQGVQATMRLPDGSTQPLTTVNIRSTEYTVGDSGPAAMPGSLPPQSGYTYAVELSVDEALAVGATDVHFTQPLYHYVENFINFPVGMAVPNGYYDRARAAWVPAPDGRVVKIVAINAGLVDLDTNGDTVADNDAALGITTAERQQLALLYQSGQSLWRVPIDHFTPWDHNWPFGPPDDALPPDRMPPGYDKKPENPCEASGSIIECETQVVGQRLEVVGTPYTLNYRSDRTLGRSSFLDIPITGATLPESLASVVLVVSIAGKQTIVNFAPLPNQSYEFTWDHKDAYDRTVVGARKALVRIGYTYAAQYDDPQDSGNGMSFGNSSGISVSGSLGLAEVTIWRDYEVVLSGWDARGQGLGGWSFDVHHVYDPIHQLLYQGDGQRRGVEKLGQVISRVAGTGTGGFNNDGPALTTKLTNPAGAVMAPDGTLYFAESARIRRLNPNGTITTIAGTGTTGYNGDGILATQAQLNLPKGLAIGTDGSLYISDSANHRVRRIDASGIITTVAGTGQSGYTPDGVLATQSRLSSPEGIAFSADGSLYIADTANNRLRRISPNGIISTVAGTGAAGSSGDGGPAKAAKLWNPRDVAIGPDGSLYIADWINDKVRRVSPDGLITTVAGNGGFTFGGDGVPATNTSVGQPYGVEVGPDGSLYILHGGFHLTAGTQPFRVRRVLPNGIITTIAGGNSDVSNYVNNVPATTATLNDATAIALSPDGSIYITEKGYDDIRRVAAPLPGFTGTDLAIPAADGTELYQFTREGRHLRTLSTLTGATLYTFAYTASGLLQSITDGSNNVTTIERTPDGTPTAVVGPYGERTVVGLDGNGYLNLITNPAQETIHLEYSPQGLLTRMSDPRNSANASTYIYDPRGRLERNNNAAGGYQTFTRTTTNNSYTVTKQNALGHVTQYIVTDLATGGQRRQVIAPNGAVVTTETRLNGTTITTDTRGVVTTMIMGADPRWGMQAPYVRQITSRTPSGQTFFTMTANRTVTLLTPDNLLAVQTQSDTVTINGRTTTAVYQGPPRVLITTNPSGEVRVTNLDTLGRPVQVTGAVPTVVYHYDSHGRLDNVQEGTGDNLRTTVLTYDALGYLDTVTDPLQGVTSFDYDGAGRLTAQQLPSLHWLHFDYDDAGNLSKQINAQGIQTDFVYDAHHRLQSQTVDTTGRAVRSEFFYDLADNLTRAVADVGPGQLNLTTHYTYTPFSPGGEYLVQQVMDPEGHATSFTYTPAGDLRTAIDALGHTTTYTYTVQGWLNQMRTAEGRMATMLYTNDGQPDLVIDPRGSMTDYVYDAVGRVHQVIAGTVALGSAPAINQTITYVYDVNDRVRSVTDGRNQNHEISYDYFGRLAWETDPLGNKITYEYDQLDRLVEQIVGANNPAEAVTTRYSYDAAGRRTTMRLDPDGLNLTTVYSYTQPGSSDTWNLQQVRDPKGQVTKYSYNSLGLRAATTDALNHTWTFAYDNLGRLDYQTDPLGHLVDYVVDGLGRTAELHQDGRVEKWAFRPDGALANYTDFAGRVTTFAYDNDQLLTGIDYPAPMADVGYGYDAAGNVTSVSDGLGSTSYSYDVLNRLDSRTRGSRVIDYGYSATNQVTSIDYWGQGTVGYGYDNAGRLDTLTPWGGAATTYSYRSSGLLAGISRPNSVATTYSYDTASRLTGLNHVQGGSNSLNNIVYGLDANGNRDWMTDLDGLTDYVYDALNRLDAVTYPAIPGGPPAATIDYSMDEVGNRTGDGTTTYGHDASDRITNSGFVYDTNGNQLSDGVKSYEYDAANHLTKVISGSVTIDYAYDGWGNLIQESSNGVTTEYVLDERGALPTILGEVRSDGTERLYAYGPEGFAAQKTVGGAVEYPLLDGLGSVRHLTDSSGNVTLSRSYDAFGNLRYSNGTGVTRLGYTGELQDQLTGLVYLRARFYHPVFGRFLQRDSFAGSIGRGQSLNRYAYTENNPANLTDPSGNCPWCIAAGIGAGAGAAFEYGGQVYQNYRDGQSGSDMFRPRDWGKIGQAAVAGGVGGLTGFYLGPAAAGMMRFGSPMMNSIAAGALEGAGSGALSQIATNLIRGCAWNADLTRSLLMGGLGGGIGGALSQLSKRAARSLSNKLTSFRDRHFRLSPAPKSSAQEIPQVNPRRYSTVNGSARGHGLEVRSRPQQVPPNCSLLFGCASGRLLSDDTGRLLEEGFLEGEGYEFLKPGQSYYDHVLLNKDAGRPIRYSSEPVGIVIEASKGQPIWLSEIFEMFPDGIDLRWAACRACATESDVADLFK